MRFRLPSLALALLLAGCSKEPVITPTPQRPNIPESRKPLIALPNPPHLTAAGHALVLEYETGGRGGYNPRPEWPGGHSGTTVGIGYDCGYFSRSVILNDWQELANPARTRLAATAGITGSPARAKVQELHDIIVQWDLALDVFDSVDVAREFGRGRKAMPGMEDLRPNAQAALISLGFNRGWGMSGDNRSEMRAIRDLVPKEAYSGMATQLRKMVRVWKGTSIENGMRRRRIAEANLMETP